MLYSEFQLQSADDPCHFCHPKDRVFIESEAAFLTYGLAPYHRHHLLVIPKRHVESFMELSRDESDQIWNLIRQGAAILLELGYETYTVVVREGKGGTKSMPHLHYHLIPDKSIGDLDASGRERTVMTSEEIALVSGEISEAIRRLAFTGVELA